MRQNKLFIWILAFALWAVSASAYKVWLGTHQWDGDGAYNLDQWDRAIENIDGINYVLLDGRLDVRADTAEWRAMIAPIDQSIPGMAEIARSQYIPGKNVSLASRMENEFATVEGRGQGEIDIIMLYDEERDGVIYNFTSEDFQEVRDWLDNNGHADVALSFDVRAGGSRFMTLARDPLIDEILIEASATKWVENGNGLHTALKSFWTDSRTDYKPIRFQVPRSENSTYNQYEETRRALKTIKELMGDEFMRSDRVSFIICNYSDRLDLYPETTNNDTLYTNSKSGIALSLIEQRDVFEGRTGVLDQAFCISYARDSMNSDPTSGLVAHWPLDEGSGTSTTNLANSSYIATLESGATWGSDAERGSYVSFDGIDDRIATSFYYALADTNDFTWAWWANKQSADGTDTGSIMVGSRYGDTGGEAYEFIKFTPTSVQFANTSDAGEIERFTYADVPHNEWHHYAMVKSGTSYQWYVDGVAAGSPETLAYNETSAIPFFIGGDPGATKEAEFFQGFIDDVVLYRSALSPEEVVNVKNEIYLPTITMVVAGPAESTAGTTWSDGLPAHSGADYIISGNLKSEDGSSTFPGTSLTVEAGGKFQFRSKHELGETTTVDRLITMGGTTASPVNLAAGTGNNTANHLGGALMNDGYTLFSGYGNATGPRNIRISSVISGDGTLFSTGSAAYPHTCTIANTANTFSGVWQSNVGTLAFENAGAVGSANIEVLDSGKLTITGDWNSGAALTVADSATALVDMGNYRWVVSSLVFGDLALADGRYSAAALNALGENAVFTGSGSIYVGTPPTYGLIAGWEQWTEGASPATIQSNGLTATASIGGFGVSKWGACTDGTFGALASPVASTATADHADGLRKTGVTDISVDFTIENTSVSDLELETLYFDAMLKTADTGPKQWNLQVVSGGLTTGGMVTNSLAYNKTGSDLTDYSVDLTQLADYTLNGGETVVLRLTFTGGDASNTGNVDMDNVGITGAFIAGTEPMVPPTMLVEQVDGAFSFSWAENGFKVQSRTNLTEGIWADYENGDVSPVTVTPSHQAAFFRLIKQ